MHRTVRPGTGPRKASTTSSLPAIRAYANVPRVDLFGDPFPRVNRATTGKWEALGPPLTCDNHVAKRHGGRSSICHSDRRVVHPDYAGLTAPGR